MPRRHLLAIVSALLSTACVLGSQPAWSFLINIPPPTVTVTEFRNVNLDHYFLTADPQEMAAIDAGAAGPGWMRTGYGFTAYAYANSSCGGCLPVSRFYGTPGLGPNSHFYTAEAAEAEGLKRPGSGWSFEGTAFAIAIPQDGACANGVPVYRLYNNRWMFNDSNHRYVTSASERAAMQVAGWIDEGAHFCALGIADVALKSYEVSIPLDRRIMPSAQCEDERINLGGCLAVNNLPVPNVQLGPYMETATKRYFMRSTGMLTDIVYAPSMLPASTAASGLFVQGGDGAWGLNVDSRVRGSSIYSSVNPLYQFRTTVPAGTPDTRLFPWAGAYPFETQLSVVANVMVQRITVRDSNSHAYGHPTLEFIDRHSGRHLYFTVLAYGTVPAQDYLAPDVATGKVIVGTTFRDGSPYLRSLGSGTLSTPPGTDQAILGNGAFGSFEFRLDRAEFQRIVDSARSVDAALSPDPADYLLDNFHFTNEVVGDGEIGIYIGAFALRILRR
jgi:hypothetical protein